jgi:hypothetical protein
MARELIFERQACSQRIHEPSITRLYMPINTYDEKLLGQILHDNAAFHRHSPIAVMSQCLSVRVDFVLTRVGRGQLYKI